MAEYFMANSKIVVNGFVRAGITAAMDGRKATEDKALEDLKYDTESDIEMDSDV